MPEDAQELQRIYRQRFAQTAAYRQRVWEVLVSAFFQRWISPTASVLDLGCGYGEFINQVRAQEKLAMDLNPDASRYLQADVQFLHQDCSQPWPLPENCLDIVFTSNFFEHLPDKECLKLTLRQARRCLKPGGQLLVMGPNIKYLPGEYWDFFDHHTILTEASLAEVLEMEGYRVDQVTARFLPYTLVNSPQYPLLLLRLYLALPWLWRIKGRQFFVVASKPAVVA
jgi:SAM-dependent methyltransferase